MAHSPTGRPEKNPQTHPQYRADIDGLRAIAVLSVVFFHMFPKWLKGGFVGVDIFFVISGFLISGILLSRLEINTFSFSEFYTRRIKRIFPALILVLIASFVLGWLCVLLAVEFKQLGKHIAAGAGFVSNLVLWQEAGYFDNDANTKPLLHLWSLGVEEQFYVFWPMLLWMMHRLKLNVLAVTMIIVTASFIVNVTTVASDTMSAFYSPLSRFWELLLGGGLAYLATHRPRWKIRLRGRGEVVTQILGMPLRHRNERLADIQSVFGLLLIALSIAIMNKNRLFPGWWALLPTIGAYCILSAGPRAWLNRTILASRALVGIGLISYPLYLWHWPLLVFARIVNGDVLPIPIRYGILLFSLLLAWLTYWLIEKPIRFGSNGRAKTAVLCVVMLLVGASGFYTYERGGFDFRYPYIIRQLTKTSVDDGSHWRSGKCFLSPEEKASAFDSECLETNKRPLVFLWGDSHAAAIYPGLKNAQTRYSFGIGQYTASACPPLMQFETRLRPNCHDINEASLEAVKKARPDIVLLHADWTADYDLSTLDNTIARLKEIGVPRIVLLGPVPQWKDTLPRDILANWRNTRTDPPLRMKFRLVSGVPADDHKMAAISQRLNVEYISAYQALCDEDGCLTRTSEDSTDITTFDSAHLTPEGADVLIGRIEERLFRTPAGKQF